MEEMVRVVLPQRYRLVVNDTFQLFYRGIVDVPNPSFYSIVAVCEKGKNFPRYFEFVSECAGEFRLKVFVYGANGVLLGKGETILDVMVPKAPTRQINILTIGSSSSLGIWQKECLRRLCGMQGNPEGLGFSNISFIGTQKNETVGYEAYGGWNWENFYSTEEGSMWIVGENDKTIEDQHTLWKDHDGNVWQLETLGGGKYLKFNRYKGHKGTRPESGRLIHDKNAVHTAPIDIARSWEERRSPFYDEESRCVNFKTYCSRNRYSGIDAVYVSLGGNGLHEMTMKGLSLQEHCKTLVARGKLLIDQLHRDYPGARVVIMGLAGCSVNGGMGANYGATLPYCDVYGYTRYVLELNRVYEAWTKEPGYCEYMEFLNVSGQFDAENCMPAKEKPVNTRSAKTELIGTNGLHALVAGQMQVADAAYRSMVHLCNLHSEKV